MTKDLILALESSCDDTSICLLKGKEIIFEETTSSDDIVSQYGGVVPELVAREHPQAFFDIFNRMKKVCPDWKSRIKRIAYTDSPGFIGSLIVSKIIAMTLSLEIFGSAHPIDLKKISEFYEKEKLSLLKVNHIDGHCFSAFVEQKQVFPFIATIISGGHTQIFLVKSFFEKTLLSETRDDAIGEAYDKVGRLLKVPFPWGKNIDELVGSDVKKHSWDLSSPLLKDGSFSFSGIKSKVSQIIRKFDKKEIESNKKSILEEFQYTCQMSILERTFSLAEENDCRNIAFGGGVSANSFLRSNLNRLDKEKYSIYLPKQYHSVDNATMIAWATKVAFECYIKNKNITVV